MDKLNTIKLFLYENKRKIIFFSTFVIAITIVTVFFINRNLFNNKNKIDKLVYENIMEEKVTPEDKNDLKVESQEEKIYYFIDIKGYVNNPGVYSLEKGKRVVDAINKAGGLKSNANTSLLNLSMELKDSMVIVVYSNDEIKNYQKTKEKETLTEKICTDKIINDACLSSGNDTNSKSESKEKESPTIEKININTASKEALMTLSKIGESKALAIIEYRNKVGLFKSISELKNVSGIGDILFEAIKDYITI